MNLERKFREQKDKMLTINSYKCTYFPPLFLQYLNEWLYHMNAKRETSTLEKNEGNTMFPSFFSNVTTRHFFAWTFQQKN